MAAEKKIIIRRFESEETIEIKTRGFLCKGILHGEKRKSKQEGEERERKDVLEHGFSNLNVCTDHMVTLLT